MFVWTYATVLALPTLLDSRVYGYWIIKHQIDTGVICWIKSSDSHGSVNIRLWVMFYIPLLIIYSICAWILMFTYLRLKSGIPRTILHRMKTLVTNAINISIYLVYFIVYWIILGICYGCTYLTAHRHDDGAAYFFFSVLLYLISAKGFSSIIVWIVLINVDIQGNLLDKQSDKIDKNDPLRQEILHFATLGIRSSTRITHGLIQGIPRKDNLIMSAIHRTTRVSMFTGKETTNETKLSFDFGKENNTLVDVLTPSFFIKLVFGRSREIQLLNKLIRENSAISQQSLKELANINRMISEELNSVFSEAKINGETSESRDMQSKSHPMCVVDLLEGISLSSLSNKDRQSFEDAVESISSDMDKDDDGYIQSETITVQVSRVQQLWERFLGTFQT